jgi:Tol biopolymer transport system component
MLRACLVITVATVSVGPAAGTAASRMVLRQAWPDAPADLPAAAISADGRYVAFVTAARLTATDTDVLDDIYVLDRETQQLVLATAGYTGGASDGASLNPQLNANGRYLAFNSQTATLTGTPDRNEEDDIFVRDRLESVTTDFDLFVCSPVCS